MNPQHLLDYFVVPALEHLAKLKPACDSLAARQFVMAIAAQESHGGKYWKQLGNGPARSPWQIEPTTHRDLLHNYLSYRPELLSHVQILQAGVLVEEPLISNPLYAAAIARLLIYRTPEAMPCLNDKDGMWRIYKRYYNTYQGKATKEEWDHNWKEYVSDLDLGGAL